MGYLRPTAIIVTSYKDRIPAIHERAVAVFHQRESDVFEAQLVVTDPTPPLMNGSTSFLIAWDGSKEGWSTSDVYDERRAEFVHWLRAQAYEDGPTSIDWVEVQYGGDDGVAVVLSHQNDEVPVE